MRYFSIIIIYALLISGCSFHQKQNDLAENQYQQVDKHVAPLATYVGDWSINTPKWLKRLIINNNGSTKVVLHPGYGAIEGKVFLHDNRPHIILKDGTKAEIVSVGEEELLLEAYGKLEKFMSM